MNLPLQVRAMQRSDQLARFFFVVVEQPAPVEAEPGGLIARFPGALREWL
jgi:hypothetical protein